MNQKRVAIFLDNSNIFHNIKKIKKSNPSWVCLYDPLFLAKKLAGKLNLVYVGFYCVRPPSYLLAGSDTEKRKYNIAQKYYGEIEKLNSVAVKFGYLKGTRGDLHEKNLDTRISTDMVTMAALDEYDVAILISNDGDYESAVENTKKFKKKIVVAFFKGSLSWSLRENSDNLRRMRRCFFVKLDGLEKFCHEDAILDNSES